MWADTALVYDAEVGDVWPGHPGNEVIVGGESNWTVMIYGHEDSWQAVRLFQEDWYVTNLAIGDADPDEPGLEMVNVGWHGNVSMVYWDDSANKWVHVELINGLEDGFDWGYGVSIDDFDPRYAGNEIAVTDDLGQLMLIRKDGSSWVHEVIWQEGGPGIVYPYLDNIILADFDPEHDGKEILVTGGSKWLTEIYYNGSDEWVVKRLWKDRLSPIQIAVADILDEYEGLEIATVGLSRNLTVLHWNGSAWEGELVYTDSDVIYDVEIGNLVPGTDQHLITGGWSSDVVTHQFDGQNAWTSEKVFYDDAFVFGITIGDFDDLHPGNEIVIVDRSGIITKLQYETSDFVLYSPATEVSAAAGSSASFDVMAYSRADYDEEVAFEALGLPNGWSAGFSPGKVVPTGHSTLKIDVPVDATPGKVDFTVKGTGASKKHTIVLTVNVLPPGEKDFSLRASPSSQSVVADFSAKFTIMSEPINGFSDEISCSATGLPDGATSKWSKQTLVPPESVTIEVKTLSSTPKGTHYIAITCDGGGKDHVVTVSLFVQDANSPDFSIGLAPSTVEAVGSRSVEVTINVISMFGFSDPVSLSASGMPNEMAVAFSQVKVSPTGNAVLNITPAASLPKGAYYIVVTGTSGKTVHSATLRINLNTLGNPDFIIKAYPETANVTASGSTFFNVTVNPLNDFGGSVGLSVTGLPPDTIAIFTPEAIKPFDFAVLEIKTLVSTPTGKYEITMVGKGSGLEKSITLVIEVLPARPLLNMIKLGGPGSDITADQKVRYQAWMENIGLVNATGVSVELLVDDKVVDTGSVSLTPGSGGVVDLSWKASEGAHNVTARIVPRPDVDIEMGSISRTVTVSGPLSVDSGLWALALIIVVIIIVSVIAVGYLIGQRKARRMEEEERRRRRKKGSRKRKRT